MFFTASKIFWFVANPLSFLTILLGVAAILLATRWRMWGRRLIVAIVTFLAAFILLPMDQWLLYPLEQRFADFTQPPDQVDGIVILGGSQSTQITAARGRPSFNDSAERMFALLSLIRRFPNAPIVFSGGSGDLLNRESKESDTVRLLLVEFGINPDRVLYEETSSNTYENAVFSKELAKPKPGQVWLLVTSAAHMPRSVGCFRAIGWEVVPLVVDFNTTGLSWLRTSISPTYQLEKFGAGIHAWIGLAVYYLTGKTSEFLPGPRA